MARKNHMAVDQWGNTFHNLGPHPRKVLLEKLGRRKASPVFCDGTDGKTYRTGWFIAGHWFSVLEVTPMRVLVSGGAS